MPQITVDYSADLDGRLDRPALAGAVHRACVDTVAARTPACKTRFRRAEETVVGDGAEEATVVHVEIALLAGRTEEAKAALAESVLALLPAHIEAPAGVHLSTEVRDLEPAYRSARS
ncbi:5-carboxymethyl-2-hydroxymuconate Delta-isomerase [Streptomyces sp. SID14478]|uniref:5-carboxymethyl-2-hydroxymuconate Delta-isomerase n=1 Tax=Streptomyces sp. SID14478 TaxID=2706073 RepID=UPI0013DD6732|nr:5-carboxymethyl-2-hydroxymuconate Delta-isomerase [Streptomyces sp. SID14478]NEB76189.1 5-carboxymethyl-2-hydroxymuconate Delta-isomerase [Streptomyces sp. SID14478]